MTGGRYIGSLAYPRIIVLFFRAGYFADKISRKYTIELGR